MRGRFGSQVNLGDAVKAKTNCSFTAGLFRAFDVLMCNLTFKGIYFKHLTIEAVYYRVSQGLEELTFGNAGLNKPFYLPEHGKDCHVLFLDHSTPREFVPLRNQKRH